MKMTRKLIALLMAVLMLAVCLTVNVGAAIKESYAVGSIVYLRYSGKEPNMKAGVIDDTWGEKLIHLTKDTKNAGLYKNTWDYDNPKPEENTYVDIWAQFDDKFIYFAFFTNDLTPLGGMGGDSVCLMMEVGNKNLTYICETDPDTGYMHTYRTIGAHLGEDDFTPEDYGENEERQLTWLEKDGGFYIKYNVPMSYFDLKEKDLEEGVAINFNFIRNILTDASHYHSGDGNIYWGKWFTKSLGQPPYYVEDSAKAKGPNTFILKKTNKEQGVFDKLMNDGEYKGFMKIENPIPILDPVTPVISDDPAEDEPESPSSWAKEEVTKAIAEGLVPVTLRKNYTKGISRANLALILNSLLDKVYGTEAATGNARFNDTTDKNVLRAANLGIINGYDAGNGTYNFKPGNTLKRSEMSAIINRVAKLCGKTTTGFEKEVTFADTANHWCKSELGWPVHVGIVKGTSDTTFSPENTLTTEQTIMMIYRAYEALK